MRATKPLGKLGVGALGFLVERPMHPYEMYQLAVQRGEDRVVKASPGSLYRAVYSLEAEGLVRATGTDRDGARPERTTFEITQAGRDRLVDRIVDMLRTPINEFPEFALAISEAHNLQRGQACDLLRERVVALRAQLDELDDIKRGVAERGVPRIYWINADYTSAMTTAEIHWIETTVAEIESGELPWHDPAWKARKQAQHLAAQQHHHATSVTTHGP